MEEHERGEQPPAYKYVIEYRQSSTKYGRGFYVRAVGDDLRSVINDAASQLAEAKTRLDELAGRVCCGLGEHDLDECQQRVKEASRA